MTGTDNDSQPEQQFGNGLIAAVLVIIGFIVILCIYTQKKDSAGAERDSQKMKRFEITYKMNKNAQAPVSIGTVANNEKKALKAFSLKVPGIPKDQIIAVNGQPVKEEWLSAYPKNVPKISSNSTECFQNLQKQSSDLMACPYCSAKISKRAEHCPKCNNTILKECMVCGSKIRVASKEGCPKCGDPEPFSGPEGSAFGKNSRDLLKVCPSCGCSISERAPQCSDCHTPTIVPCKVCGKKISCWSQTCPECGDPEPFKEEGSACLEMTAEQFKQTFSEKFDYYKNLLKQYGYFLSQDESRDDRWSLKPPHGNITTYINSYEDLQSQISKITKEPTIKKIHDLPEVQKEGELLKQISLPSHYKKERLEILETTTSKNPFSLAWFLFSFDGRIGRQSFWCSVPFMMFFLIIMDLSVESSNGMVLLIFICILVLLLWVSLAIQVKRWHDRNKSAIWLLLSFVPIIGFFWVWIELGFLKGTTGHNAYGDDPLSK